ncbi:MAG: hypothetical protein K2O89_03260 [Clostridia bacterium]|nr:hypothetical protein [Clostridia bacterium]
MFKDKILEFLDLEEQLNGSVDFQRCRAIPEKCYYLSDGVILCYPRSTGDSRYPYSADGFTLWAYSSGYMSLNESTFYYVLPADEGKEPYIAFFGGLERENGFEPFSITGAARIAMQKIKRFTVYTTEAVYYIAKTDEAVFFLRAFVSKDKQAIFSVGAINKSGKEIKCTLSSFFNCLLMHQAGESVETKWFKQCQTTENGFIFESIEDVDRTTHLQNYGVINRAVNANVIYCEHTSSRSDFAGGKNNSISCATPLFTGHFEKCKKICKFGDTAAAGDIYCVELAKDGFAQIDYVAEAYFDEKKATDAVRSISPKFADEICTEAEKLNLLRENGENALKMSFGKCLDGDINGETFTKFVHSVQRQTEFAALAKNSGVSLLGVRDVVQQMEAALLWRPTECRAKFLELLNFIDPSGRAPRQYSIPAKGALPQMDTRAFIDQGVWIITAMRTYLSFTGDYSILDEECGYYKIVGKNRVEEVEERNSVAEHLVRIADYLINNMDSETGCLRALYGDWNDALDGLGVSRNPDEEYGSGVSVMASLQLYRNLGEMIEIAERTGDKFKQKHRYISARKRLKNGLLKYAIETENGERKILHGWGDGRSYKVGSFNDVDGESRDGLTANAFWIISSAYLWDKSIKKDVLASYKRLDSKYGLKTFEPYFKKGTPGVGRIVNLPKGTAENGAVYVHAAMFGIWSLYGMGESAKAWEQLKKVLPLTHELITTTPFIMSNSYAYNEELGLDGESMSDWFTGSANVLIKALVWYLFGITPDLDGVKINPAVFFPFENAEIRLKVKGKVINLTYRKTGGKRTFKLNEKTVNTFDDAATEAPALYLTESELAEENFIEVCD